MHRSLALPLCFSLALLAFAQMPTTDEATWKAFRQWIEARAPDSKPSDLINSYRAKLIRDGATASEADHQMNLIWKFLWGRPEGVKLFWNKVYTARKSIFAERPNALLVDAVEGRKPDKALDVGMGQGRNSVFLALRGWDVTGFDPSDEGIRIAQANAQKAGVKIRAVVATDNEFNFGHAQWDLVVITYVRTLGSSDADRLLRSLKPGGIVVYENVASGQGNETLKAFLRFRILRFEDVDAVPDWNPEQSEQKARIQRLVAQKMAP